MAIGEHWEWRGFGKPEEGVRSRLLGLRPKFPHPQELLDEYIWAPGCKANVKLREDSLKWKRLLEEFEPFQMWLEARTDTHPFPLDAKVVADLLHDLGRPREGAVPVWNRMELLDLLDVLAPEARVIPVRKKRWQMEWRPGGATIELAEIYLPESVTSIGLEHPMFEEVEAAKDALGLPGRLREMNYVDVVARWARGEKLAST